MPLLASLGAGSIGSYRLFRRGVAVAANYIEDVFSTYLYTGTGTPTQIQNSIELGDLSTNSGSAYFPTGDGDYLKINTGEPLDFGSNNFTIEFWIYPTQLGDAMVFLSSKGDGTQTGDVDIRCNYIAEAGTTVYVQAGGSGVMSASYNGDILNKWSHVAVVRNGSTVRVYFNGVFNVSATGGTQGTTNLTAVNIGGGSGIPVAGYETVTGYMAGLRVVKGTAVYTANFTPPTAPLTAISGTSLLLLQGTSPFTDASANAYSVVTNGSVSSSTFGPFTTPGSGKGGMVWIKSRSNNFSHSLFDTVRDATKELYSNLTDAQTNATQGLTAFNSNGFNLGSSSQTNASGTTFASWTFAKKSKFFDIVTYTGNGTAGRQIPHNLGSAPGCIIVKRTSATGNWTVYHRSLGTTQYLNLNLTDAAASFDYWNGTAPTATEFTVGSVTAVNGSGSTYVAYLFAHDAGGFGLSGTDNVISCGSYTGSASDLTVNLGFEPQWILFKNATVVSIASHWSILDVMRGITYSTNGDSFLYPNRNVVEEVGDAINVLPTGFTAFTGSTITNRNGDTHIYIAIRRGPMKIPTIGANVFDMDTQSSFSTNELIPTTFAPDMSFQKARTGVFTAYSSSRLTGGWLSTSSTAAETSGTWKWDGAAGQQYATSGYSDTPIYWSFRRAPGFFDVVCYTGNGLANRTVSHNLGVVPELMIVKTRNGDQATGDWIVYHKDLPEENTNKKYWLILNSTAAAATSIYGGFFSGTSNQTTTTFKFTNEPGFLGYYYYNFSSINYVAYLFASCPGVSKVGSYTGTGTTLSIDCGFTAGARFILIKRTDSTGDWYIWDTTRGIVSGNDPYLLLNSTAVEVTNTDYIDPLSSGFQISSTAPAAINANGGTFIFLAIA